MNIKDVNYTLSHKTYMYRQLGILNYLDNTKYFTNCRKQMKYYNICIYKFMKFIGYKDYNTKYEHKAVEIVSSRFEDFKKFIASNYTEIIDKYNNLESRLKKVK